MRKTFYQIFEEVDKQKTKKEKIAKLREYSCAPLKLVLGATFDPRVKWLLPEGEPPYKPLGSNSDQEGGLLNELRKLYLFTEGNTDTQRNLKPRRREELFIAMLESIDPGDAKVLIAMKDKQLPFKSITKKLVAEAFPNLSKDW
jgi:hypothetical protein